MLLDICIQEDFGHQLARKDRFGGTLSRERTNLQSCEMSVPTLNSVAVDEGGQETFTVVDHLPQPVSVEPCHYFFWLQQMRHSISAPQP